MISDSDVARLCSTLSLASCPYHPPAPRPSFLIHNLHCSLADSQAMSHKAQRVGLSHTPQRKSWGSATILNKKRVATGSGQWSWSRDILLQSHRTFCLLWLEGKNEEKTQGGRLGSWTGWLSPRSAALPEEVCLECVCACVPLLQYSGRGFRPHGIINHWYWRECVKSLAVIITLSAEIRECSARSLPGQRLTRPAVATAVWRESQARLW